MSKVNQQDIDKLIELVGGRGNRGCTLTLSREL